ncbi:DUF2637 domain-containing protein [Methanospirillum sp.]
MKGYIRTIRLILRHSFPIFKHWDEYLAPSCSFVLSFSNLRSSAVEAGFVPILAWCWPICIDALLISGSLMVLRSNVQGVSSAFGWGVLITFTGISTAFNIAHSPSGFLYQASHAIPPISLCISVEVLMNIIRSDLTAEVTAPVTPSPQLADKEDRGSQIRSYIEMHPDVTAADIARSFGVTRQTASWHLNKVKLLSENGDGTGT